MHNQCSYYDRFRVLGYDLLVPFLVLSKEITIPWMLELRGLCPSGGPPHLHVKGPREANGLLSDVKCQELKTSLQTKVMVIPNILNATPCWED